MVNKGCDEPTCDNLFMNVLPTDDFTKKIEEIVVAKKNEILTV